jgi:hypothetical protein
MEQDNPCCNLRFSRVVRAFDCQCRSHNCLRFDPSILRHSGIWGSADKTVLNNVRKKTQQKTINIWTGNRSRRGWLAGGDATPFTGFWLSKALKAAFLQNNIWNRHWFFDFFYMRRGFLLMRKNGTFFKAKSQHLDPGSGSATLLLYINSSNFCSSKTKWPILPTTFTIVVHKGA